MQTYVFRTHLLRDTRVVREIEVPESISLYKLAEAVVKAYGFDFDHCFGFYSDVTAGRYHDSRRKYELFADMEQAEGVWIEPVDSQSVEKTKASQVWRKPGDTMMMLFDYGDGWRFTVQLVGLGERNPRKKYAQLVRSRGKAPRQY